MTCAQYWTVLRDDKIVNAEYHLPRSYWCCRRALAASQPPGCLNCVQESEEGPLFRIKNVVKNDG